MELSCEMPEIEYGGNSKEKKEQQLRENGTLQALFFDKQPNDPLEPESGGVFRVECRPIPLEDTTGEEEAVNDYSAQGWPDPVSDKFMVNNPPPSLPAASVSILENLVGGAAMIEGADRSMMDSALYAAQRAAQETLLKQGLLPSNFRDQNTPPADLDQEQHIEMEYENNFPPQQNFPSGPPPSLEWRGGAPPNRPPPHFYRGGPR